MGHLTITYNEQTVYDGDVREVNFKIGEAEVGVWGIPEGAPIPPPAPEPPRQMPVTPPSINGGALGSMAKNLLTQVAKNLAAAQTEAAPPAPARHAQAREVVDVDEVDE